MFNKRKADVDSNPFYLYLVQQRVRWCAVYSRTCLCSE